MFIKKKSFYQKKTFYVFLVALVAFGYWINQPVDGVIVKDNVSVTAQKSTESKEGKSSKDVKNADINKSEVKGYNSDYYDERLDGVITDPAIKDEGYDYSKEGKEGAYYLVKEVNGIIKIFYYDSDGTENLIKNTDITYSLISEGDQEMFSKGITVHSEDELAELMQDFES